MYTLIWKTARIVGPPDGDIWAVISADDFDNPVGALDTVAAASTLMKQALPDGGLVADYLFLEELERAALAAQIAGMQAQRDFLRCSVAHFALPAARARVVSARHRYISDTMANLNTLREAYGGSSFGLGEAYRAMRIAQSQPAAALDNPWEIAL